MNQQWPGLLSHLRFVWSQWFTWGRYWNICFKSKLTIELRTQYRVRFIRHADMRKNELGKDKSIICYEASNCTNLNGRFALEVKGTGFKYTQKHSLVTCCVDGVKYINSSDGATLFKIYANYVVHYVQNSVHSIYVTAKFSMHGSISCLLTVGDVIDIVGMSIELLAPACSVHNDKIVCDLRACETTL